MKLAANVALLTLLRSGFILKICDFDDAPYIEKNRSGSRLLIAHRPKYHQREVFSLNKAGMIAALKWASEGYVMWTQDAKEIK